jgi:RND family efflux transporter MFP subunit
MSKIHRTIPLLLAAGLWTAACTHTHEDDHAPEEVEEASWAVTAWGDRFEIFAETDELEAGRTSKAHAHVTVLADFSAPTEGRVAAVLRDASGGERIFAIDEATRPGIFSIPIAPTDSGEYDLAFRVETSGLSETIPAGRVRVGEAGDPGGLIEAAPTSDRAASGSAGAAEISFLKEQQWRTEFATSWVREGAVRESVRGPGRVEPAAGGEVLLTAPVDGAVSGSPWPFPGRGVTRGETVLRVTPRVALERSLAELESDVAGLEAEAGAAGGRLDRLEGLLELGAASRSEVEQARARHQTLASRLAAARRDLETARSGRGGAVSGAETVSVRAPFLGRIARVDVTPGQAVAVEAPLALLVRPSPLWVALALRPEAAARVGPADGLDVWLPSAPAPLTFRGEELRLVSVSPMVDPVTGTVTTLFEVAAEADRLPIGAAVDGEVLLAGERTGVVVPESALVDDGGVPVVYLQTGGESFARAEVEIVARQSGRVLVMGLQPGARLVERGGNAVRRETLVSRDVGERHAH